jgi:hypothetical protein
MTLLVDALARFTVASLRGAPRGAPAPAKPVARAPARPPPRRQFGAAASFGAPRRGGRGARLAVAASADEEDWEQLFANLAPRAPTLPAYKTAILERALARGRRQVPIRDLAADLDLTREDVLDWLKANKDRQPELAAKYPPEDEMVASVQIDPFDPRVRADGRDYDNVRDNRASRSSPSDGDLDGSGYDAQTAYLRNARTAHVPAGMPAYKGYTKKRLGATNVATLEKVFEQDRFPDDSMVDAVHRATKLPRSKIVAWFKTRREEEKAARKRAGRARVRGAAGRDLGERASREEDGFADDRRGGSRGGGRRREGREGGWRGNGGGGDAYGDATSRDSTSDWSGSGRR